MTAWANRRHGLAGAVLAAVAVLIVVLAAPALGAFSLLRSFGESGTGAGRLGPHAAGIAVDAAGHVYVADRSDERIEVFRNDGTPTGSWKVAGPRGVAAAPDGTVVVSGTAGVRRFTAAGSPLGKLSADGGLGAVAVAPDGAVYAADPSAGRVLALGTATVYGGLVRPSGVAVAPDGTLFVADAGDRRVHVFGPGGSERGSWWAGDARGIAMTPDGTVLVADGRAGRIRTFDADGSPLETIGGDGTPLNVPLGVASDCRGSAYVVDNASPRVYVFGAGGDPPPCVEPEPTATPTRTPAPSPTRTPTPTPTPKGEVLPEVVEDDEPILGVRGRATVVSGAVLVATRGGQLRRLTRSAVIPVGSTVDTTNGRVRLEFEAAPEDRPTYGRVMSGEFSDGAFVVRQGPKASLVELVLLDEGASAPASGARARIAARGRLRVWGKAKGRFRTRGRNGAATVRGTRWLTEERPEGTFFKVAEGLVAVRDFRTRRTILLHAGESYLAHAGCVSRRSFSIRLRLPSGAVARSARVTVAGRTAPVRIGRRVTARVDLRGMPEGRVVVRIRVRTVDGRTVTGKRVYRTCAAKRPGGNPRL